MPIKDLIKVSESAAILIMLVGVTLIVIGLFLASNGIYGRVCFETGLCVGYIGAGARFVTTLAEMSL